MDLEFESGEAMDVWRYSGAHTFGVDDLAQDRRAGEHLTGRLGEGQRRFLMDVRQLRIGNGSAMGAVLDCWRRIHAAGGRVAILTGRLERRTGMDGERWQAFADMIEDSQPRMDWLRMFHAEADARAFLLTPGAEEPPTP